MINLRIFNLELLRTKIVIRIVIETIPFVKIIQKVVQIFILNLKFILKFEVVLTKVKILTILTPNTILIKLKSLT